MPENAELKELMCQVGLKPGDTAWRMLNAWFEVVSNPVEVIAGTTAHRLMLDVGSSVFDGIATCLIANAQQMVKARDLSEESFLPPELAERFEALAFLKDRRKLGCALADLRRNLEKIFGLEHTRELTRREVADRQTWLDCLVALEQQIGKD